MNEEHQFGVGAVDKNGLKARGEAATGYPEWVMTKVCSGSDDELDRAVLLTIPRSGPRDEIPHPCLLLSIVPTLRVVYIASVVRGTLLSIMIVSDSLRRSCESKVLEVMAVKSLES